MTIKNRQINTGESLKKPMVTLSFKEDVTLAGVEFKANEPKKVARIQVKNIFKEAALKIKSKGNISLDEQ